MAAVLAAGAAGVRMGTRFVASLESDFHVDYKAALVAAEAGDTVYTERFAELWPGAPHRVLRSAIAAAEAGTEPIVGSMSRWQRCASTCRVSPGSRPWPTRPATSRAMALFAGEGVGEIAEVLPAGDIVRLFGEQAGRPARDVAVLTAQGSVGEDLHISPVTCS